MKKLDPYFIFDLNGMLRYFEQFDPVEYRYNLRDTFESCEHFRKMTPHERALLQNKIGAKIAGYEKTYSTAGSMRPDSSEIMQNLKLIYGGDEPINEYVNIYDIVQSKLISGYLKIDGLADLFRPEYFEYEWEQHIMIDYKKHTQSFYRDHFIHQAKDAYECMRLLVKMPGLQDSIIKSFQEDRTVVGEFVRNSVAKEYSVIAGEPDANELYRELYCESFGFSTTPDPGSLTIRHIYKNIIKSAVIMSGLFHDIGYPIEYVLKNRSHLSKFLPSARAFFESPTDFSSIIGNFPGSLLMRLIPREKLESAFNEKLHGTLSALAFLLYFYENGSIHHLRPAKRAAVELAALIMADHTNKFRLLEPENKDYFRMVNYRNPLSFLLRFCDDVQEWGRTYFYLSSSNSTHFCNSCHMPIIRGEYTSLDVKMHRFVCGCKHAGETEDEAASFYFKKLDSGEADEGDTYSGISDIRHRRLNHVQISERIRFLRVVARRESEMKEHDLLPFTQEYEYLDFLPAYEYALIAGNLSEVKTIQSGNDAYIVHVDYSLYKLLQISFVEPGFAKYRADELNKLKKLLCNNKDFPTALIHSVVTTNPVALKVRILERFVANTYARFTIAQKLYRDKSPKKVNGIDTDSPEMFNLLRKDCSDAFSKVQKTSYRNSKAHVIDLHIWMLLFSKERFTVGEVDATKWAAEETAVKALKGHSGTTFTAGKARMQLDSLLKLAADKKKRKDEYSLGLNREGLCIHSAGISNWLFKSFAVENAELPVSKQSVQTKWLCGFIRDVLKEIPPKAPFDQEYITIDKNAVNGFTDELILRCYGDGHKNSEELSKNIKLYFRLLAAAKLFVLAQEICKVKFTDNMKDKDVFNDDMVSQKNPDNTVHPIQQLLDVITTYFLNEEPLIKNFSEGSYKNDCLEVLIKDYLLQESRQFTYYSHALRNSPIPESYFEVYEQTGEVKDAIERYTKPDIYKRALYGDGMHFDPYTDLYAFMRLANAVQ